MKIAIQTEDFDVSTELAQLRARQVGALVSFVGTVRDVSTALDTDQCAVQMELEHYPGMTEKSLETIAQLAIHRFAVNDIVIIHRVGALKACDQIVLVAVASKHRGTAFSACEFVMDYLKTEAPFWKKEIGAKGSHWVDARVTDLSALEKWQ